MIREKIELDWDDYMVILIALEDHQSVLVNRLQLALGEDEKQIEQHLSELTPLRRKLHAMRAHIDE